MGINTGGRQIFRIDQAAAILSYCSGGEDALTVSGLVNKTGWNHQKTSALIRELEERGLLLREIYREGNRGRPQHLLRPTALGEQFSRNYKQLLNLSLRSNRSDIKKALHQAHLAQRLVDQGISPYARFWEMNSLAWNIRRTAQAHDNSR